MKSLFTLFAFSIVLVNSFKWSSDHRNREVEVCSDPKYRRALEEQSYYDGLVRRQSVGGGGGTVGAGVGVGNVSVGTGPINAGIGNINITIGNVTVEAGDIDIENITIGNITVLVSVALSPDSAPTQTSGVLVGTDIPATSIAESTGPPTTLTSRATTITPTPSPSDEGALRIRQDVPSPSVSLPAVTATASAGVGDVGVNVGSVGASVGNVTLTVGNILVKLGSISIKNVTIGNILVAVQLGQPNLGNGSLLGNLLGS